MAEHIPSKLYYSISEVAELTGVKAHVLRYWESEFSTLHPKKTRSGSRRYRRQDIDEVLAIKRLLYDQGYKIAGACKLRRQAHLKVQEAAPAVAPQLALGFQALGEADRLDFLKKELREIQTLLAELTPCPANAAPLKKMAGKG